MNGSRLLKVLAFFQMLSDPGQREMERVVDASPALLAACAKLFWQRLYHFLSYLKVHLKNGFDGNLRVAPIWDRTECD
jgi:hypothetical protein